MKVVYPKTVFTILLLFATVIAFAQKEFQGKVYYQTKTSVDMSGFGGGQMSEAQKKQIAENMKSALEKTYILTFNPSESLYKEEEKLDAPAQGGDHRRRSQRHPVGDARQRLLSGEAHGRDER